MISKNGTIYNTGDCVIIKVNQIAKKRIKYDNHKKNITYKKKNLQTMVKLMKKE